MRQRLVALAAAATLAATAAAPAFADSSSTSSVPTSSSLFHCNASATLTENGKQVYSVTRSFTTTANLTGSYNRSYTFNSVTYTVAANVSCSR